MRFLPGLGVFRRYERVWLRGDVLAGVTVAAYLIPQVMAMAQVAGLEPVVGFYGIIGALVVYAVLGSSPQLSCGPDSTSALMTAAAVSPLAMGDPDRYAALAAGLAVVVAAIAFAARAARLGFLTDLLSKPVLVGYLAGVASIMVSGQLSKLTGVTVDGDSFVEEVRSFFSGLEDLHWATVALGATTVAFLLVGNRLFPKFPVPLVGMVLATVVTALFSLEDHGIRLIGDIAAGLPVPGFPDLAADDYRLLLLPAVGVAIVAYSDNVLIARGFASRNNYRIDADQELLALGGANLAAAAMQAFPVSSSGSRTVIGDAMGSHTQLYSLVALATVIPTVLFARPLLELFPAAALGAVVVYAAIRLVDVAELRRIAAFRRSELALALATTAGVLVLGVLYGVLLAVGLSLIDVIRRVARPHDGILGFVPGLAGMHDIDDYPEARLVPGLIVYRYDSPLFFANAEDFHERALKSLDAAEGEAQWFVLNAEANVRVDITSLDMMAELVDELRRRGVVFAMARVKQDLRDELEAAGFVDKVGADHIFPTLPTAVGAYADWYEQQHGERPPGLT